MEKEASNARKVVLMFPWLAHGHVFPFFELAKILYKNHFHVYFLSTPVILDSLKKESLKNNEEEEDGIFSIDFVELHLPTSDDLPPRHHTTKNIPPQLMPKLLEALQSWSPNFPGLIDGIKPDLLIYDGFQPWAAEAGAAQGVPSVLFSTTSSASLSYFLHLFTFKSFDNYPYEEIHLRDYEKMNLLKDGGFAADDSEEDGGALLGMSRFSSEIVLSKSFNRGIEEKYTDYLFTLCKKRIVPVGPLVGRRNGEENLGDGEITAWLSSKRRRSTLYVAFGSENYLSKDQIIEIAKGLERTDVSFIWVVRRTSSDEETAALPPEGFLDRVKGRGMVVRDWAPQARILAHRSTGRFMSHCGWSSVVEGLYYGVPILGLPLKVDQPLNCRLVAEAGGGV